MLFAVHIFTDSVRGNELEQLLCMSRHRNNSDARVHSLELEVAKLASGYYNKFMSSYCSQTIQLSVRRYNGGRKEMTQDKQCKGSRASRFDGKETG